MLNLKTGTYLGEVNNITHTGSRTSSTSSRRGREAMLKLYGELKGSDDYGLGEDEMNELGLRLLYDKKDVRAAVEVLKLNAEEFPRSFNVWDGLVEAHYRAGNREEAIRNYEKSLQLNPDNVGGKRMLEKIRSEKQGP